MNKYVYVVRDNCVSPFEQKGAGFQNGVYQHHTAIIEEHNPEWTATAWTPAGGYEGMSLTRAMFEVTTGGVPIICFHYKKEDKNFGPSEFYVVIER